MDATRFDAVSKLFASRRLSRRQALATGGAGLAAGALATAGLAAPARAQDAGQKSAQDAAQPDGKRGPTMLFVQSFRAGSVAPKDGEQGRYTLTLEQGLGETVYFSDRPDLVVGSTPTPRFLATLGFPEDNPPNAALIAETAPGQTEIAVLRLYSPAYDEPTHTATYDVAVLQSWERSQEQAFTETEGELPELLPQFGAAHLFIDGCPGGDMACYCGGAWVGTIWNAQFGGYCYTPAGCLPCANWTTSVDAANAYWAGVCADRFNGGSGGCEANGVLLGYA
jgi:hypothetical protein